MLTIRNRAQKIRALTNGGHLDLLMVGNFANLGEVWYNCESIANILSLAEICKVCSVMVVPIVRKSLRRASISQIRVLTSQKPQKPCEAFSSKIHSCASQNGAHSLHQPRFVVCEGYEHHFVKRKKIKCISIRRFSCVLSVFCVWFECKWRIQAYYAPYLVYIRYVRWFMYVPQHTLLALSWILTPDSWRPVSCDLEIKR
jgi:hypothetical protein